jgi:hypothetical protein
MPYQDETALSPVDACPTCRARAGDGHSLDVPNGAVIKPGNGHPEAPAVPVSDPLPSDIPAPEPRPFDAVTHSIQFWQGLAAGLGVAIVALFLLAIVLAG